MSQSCALYHFCRNKLCRDHFNKKQRMKIETLSLLISYTYNNTVKMELRSSLVTSTWHYTYWWSKSNSCLFAQMRRMVCNRFTQLSRLTSMLHIFFCEEKTKRRIRTTSDHNLSSLSICQLGKNIIVISVWTSNLSILSNKQCNYDIIDIDSQFVE